MRLIYTLLNKVGIMGRLMPPIVKTREQIIRDLNAENKGTWAEIPGPFSMTVPEISNKNTVNYASFKEGIVVTAFLNLNTTEVRFFVSKFIDTPERDNLWQ